MRGEPLARAPAPPAQAGCCQQIPHPTSKPLPRSSCISKGSRDVVTATSLAPRMARGPLTGGRCRASGWTSSPLHTYCQSAKSCLPCGPGTHRRGEHPRGQPATAPGVCQALIRLRASADAAGFSSQPGKEASAQPGAGRQCNGCRDAQGCGIPWESPAGIGMQCTGATGRLLQSCGMP